MSLSLFDVLAAFIRKRKEEKHTPCTILKMYFHGVSMMFGLASGVRFEALDSVIEYSCSR